jgi:hypothetical protein
MANPRPAGETNLAALLRSMTPVVHPATFAFCALPPGASPPAGCRPRCAFLEPEGLSLVVEEPEAISLGLEIRFRCRMITLSVHSSLEAVGFLAALTARLAAAGIAVNVVSACFHDHLFVPPERADEALAILRGMAV